MANPFVHVELASTDPAKAKNFYGKLFGWTLEDMPMPDGTYTVIKVGSGTGGGLMKHPMPDQPSLWIPYVEVDNLAASTEKVMALGGKVLKGVTPVAEMGSFSILQDPTGGVLGLWQTKKAA